MKTNRSQRHRINYSSHDADVSVYINIRQTNENSPYSNLNHKTFFGIFGFGLRLEYGTPSLKSRLIESKCYQVNENVSHASACARFMKQTMWSLSLDFFKNPSSSSSSLSLLFFSCFSCGTPVRRSWTRNHPIETRSIQCTGYTLSQLYIGLYTYIHTARTNLPDSPDKCSPSNDVRRRNCSWWYR